MGVFTLSEKNVSYVSGLIRKFFQKDRVYKTWHQFNCGMKKRIGSKTSIRMPGELKDTFVSTNNKAFNVNCAIRKNNKWYPTSITYLDKFTEDCGFCLKLGDKVAFYGNRIVFRTLEPFGNGEHRHLYTCFQK